MTAAEQPRSIPPHLRRAFREAVWRYETWTLPEPEIEVDAAGMLLSMSAICDLVDGFDDPLPDDVIEKLMSYIREIRYTLLRQKLLDQKTYTAAAHCFRRLIDDRKRQARL